MYDCRDALQSVNENLERNSNFFTDRCRNDIVPDGTKIDSSPEKVKEYVLTERDSLTPGVTPRFEENPFAPAGSPPDVYWDKTPEVRYSQQFHDGGHTSGKLFRCGLSWRHVTYYDEDKHPVSFPYGYALPASPDDEVDDPLEQAVKEIQTKYWLKANGFDVPDDTDEPGRTEKKTDASEHTPEFLAQERERDKARRKRQQKRNCKDLVNKNYLNYMYTLTFALERNPNVYGLRFILEEEKQRDRTKVEWAWNSRLTAIRRELKKRGIRFKYVKVLERHHSDKTDERKRDTYHIHLATDRPIDKYLLQELWGYGVVWVDDFNKAKTTGNAGKTVNVEREGCVLSPGDYMAKYLDKDFDEADELGKRAYSPSKNLRHVKPDKDTDTREYYLKHPAKGFSAFDWQKIRDIEPALSSKIQALQTIEDVKVFDTWVQVEFQRGDRETGECETVKLWIHYEYYNFRVLMENARNWRKTAHKGGKTHGR